MKRESGLFRFQPLCLCRCGLRQRSRRRRKAGASQVVKLSVDHSAIAGRFWSKVRKSAEPADCWFWAASTMSKAFPYGKFMVALGAGKRSNMLAHRISWEIANQQQIPPGMFVLHSCDNPRCVNPAHLSLGTPRDNMRDMHRKGRCPRRGNDRCSGTPHST